LIEKTGYPLIPIDLTMANLIAHDLIGEPYANELDMMAAIFASKMPCIKFMQEMKALTEQIKYEKSCGHWDEVWSKWSNFDKDQVLSLSIKLNG